MLEFDGNKSSNSIIRLILIFLPWCLLKFLLEDATNLFFLLHLSDNFDIVHVTQLVIGDNCHIWSQSMTMGLSVKNKLGFIDISIPKPSYPTYMLIFPWLCYNNMMISWILNFVSLKFLLVFSTLLLLMKSRSISRNDTLKSIVHVFTSYINPFRHYLEVIFRSVPISLD